MTKTIESLRFFSFISVQRQILVGANSRCQMDVNRNPASVWYEYSCETSY